MTEKKKKKKADEIIDEKLNEIFKDAKPVLKKKLDEGGNEFLAGFLVDLVKEICKSSKTTFRKKKKARDRTEKLYFS